jgi:hypothetical protein
MAPAGGGPGGGHRLRVLFPQESCEYWFHCLMVVVSGFRRERVVAGRLAKEGSVSRAGVRPGNGGRFRPIVFPARGGRRARRAFGSTPSGVDFGPQGRQHFRLGQDAFIGRTIFIQAANGAVSLWSACRLCRRFPKRRPRSGFMLAGCIERTLGTPQNGRCQ